MFLRKTNVKKKSLFAIFSIILLILTIYLFYENTSLLKLIENKSIKLNTTLAELNKANNTISSLNMKLSEKNIELSNSTQQLFSALTMLNLTKNELNKTQNELVIIKTELEETTKALNQTKQEFVQLTQEIIELEASINSSIQWFKNNSIMPYSLTNVKNSIINACVEDNVLKLACIPHFLEVQYGIKYKLEKSDKLYSISEMFNRSGGDCEDYSLFLKALLNSLKQDKNKFKIQSWIDGTEKYIFYETTSSYFYYNGAPKSFDYVQDLNYYIICYTTQYIDSLIEGHCLLALSKENLHSLDDLYLLDNAQTFEPQNGKYAGEIGKDFYICEQEEKDCEQKINKIRLIISDTDLYHFKDKQWKSYALYQEHSFELKQNITNIIKDY